MIHVLILSDIHHIVKSLSIWIRTDPSLCILDATPHLIRNINHLPDNTVIIVDINLVKIEPLIKQISEKYRVILYSGSMEIMDIPCHLQKTSSGFFNAYTSPEEIIKIVLGCI
ncbi:hypothetical protein JNUCC31_30400 [Paenibacillus sp. JNUCC31]|uniref:hypothetical protein n=1 Tax=Paenibacillus sp. JNUCC-31 TaxID=2777983 RepID=UPI0017823575|nr:hypothetical protein [Paenibacillus sp. JNUCC-31]QOS78934.1 hypothetical protein JNUCC31_30400 [Paenibacillus sp. JNUCC-31]